MNEKKYINLTKNIEERLELLSKRLNLNQQDVEINYITRLNNIKRAYPQEYKDNESKLLVKAYQGTVKFYEDKVK